VPAASETHRDAGFARSIASEATPLNMWGGDTLVYRSIVVLSAAAMPVVAAVDWQQRGSLPWPQLALAAVALLSSLLCYRLSRNGSREGAAALLIVVLWSAITVFSFWTGFGMHSAAIFIYLPCLLYTMLFFGLAYASAALALTIAALLAMFAAEESGHLNGAAAFAESGSNFIFFVGIVLTSIGTLIAGTVYHRRVEHEAARVLAEAERRRVALEMAQAAQAQVETAHAALLELNARIAASDSARGEEIGRAGRELELLHAALSRDLPAARRAGEGAAAALLDALEKLADYGSRPLRNERLDLSSLAQEAVRQVRANPERARASFEVEPGMHAFGDRGMIAALLHHLADRAARACLGEAAPRARVGTGLRNGQSAFFVRDNGPGLNAAERAMLINPFGQGAAAPDAAVASARLIAECHGGELAVESVPGMGTTVWFSLPT